MLPRSWTIATRTAQYEFPITDIFIDCSSQEIIQLKVMGGSLKRLSHEFLTPFPERVSIVCIERISAYPFADGGDARVLRHRLANVAVLAISPTDFVSGSHHAGPYRSSGSLRNGLPLEGCPPLCRKMQIDLVDNGLDTAGIYVTGKLGSLCLPDAPPQHARHGPGTVRRRQRRRGRSPSSIGHRQRRAHRACAQSWGR